MPPTEQYPGAPPPAQWGPGGMGPGQPGLPGQPQPGWGGPQPKKSSTPLILAITGLIVAAVGVVGFIVISGDDDGENAQDGSQDDGGLTTREPDDDPGTDPTVETTSPPATDTLPATTETSTSTTLAADPSHPAAGLAPDEVAEMIVTIPSCEDGAELVAPEVQDAMLASCSDGTADEVSSFILSEDDSTAEVEIETTWDQQSQTDLVTLELRDGVWMITSWCSSASSCWFP